MKTFLKTPGITLILLTLAFTATSLSAQQKRAMIIIGDKPLTEGTGSYCLNNPGDSVVVWGEFWNDAYLMWELLLENGYANDDIYVFYGDGEDFTYLSMVSRYTAAYNYQEKITDFAASDSLIDIAFEGLANGTNGFPRLTQDDFLYVYTFGHGNTTTAIPEDPGVEHTLLMLPGSNDSLAYDDSHSISDLELNQYLDSIDAVKKVVVMAQCLSGGFIPEIEDVDIIVSTAANDSMGAKTADQKYFDGIDYWGDTVPGNSYYVADEYELYPGDTQQHRYRHTEYNLHLISSLKGKMPDDVSESYSVPGYQDFPLIDADTNDDGIISIAEAFDWEILYNSWRRDNGQFGHDDPQLSQTNNMAAHTSLEYPTLLFGNIAAFAGENISHRGIIGITKDAVLSGASQLTFHDNADVYLLNDASLTINEGSTLIIEDSAVLYGKRGVSNIDIFGDLQLGNHVTFVADSACQLILNLLSDDTTVLITINNTLFNHAVLHSTCDSLFIDSCTFENDASIQTKYGNLRVSNCEFENSYICALDGTLGNTVEIDSCGFDNSAINGSPVFIDTYTHFNIHHNTIAYKYGSGISLYNSGGIDGQGTNIIKNNEIYNSNTTKSGLKNTGVKLYNTNSEIVGWNYIHDNDYGISCLDYSQTKITGDTSVGCDYVSQRIINNNDHQVYISSASIPIDFNYNEMYEPTYSTYFIYELTQIQSTKKFDVTNNFWGENLVGNPSDYIHTSLSPDWSPMCTYKSASAAFKTKYDSAVAFISENNYNLAEAKFKEIIEDTLVSNYTYASVNQLFEIKKNYDEDYLGLQNYLDSINLIQDTTDLGKLARITSNKCDIELENYQTAINFFEDIILNSESNQDSIFAIIDLGYLYLEMNNDRAILVTSMLPQYIPESRNTYEIERDILLDLLYSKNSTSSKENEETINNEDNLISNLVLFPNPTSDITNIEFHINTTLDLNFTVYDQSGRKIKELPTIQCFEGNNNQKINLADLKNGVYYLSISSNGKSIANRKLILMK